MGRLLLGKRSETHLYNTRQRKQPKLSQWRTSAAPRAFSYRASKSWNSLSSETRNFTSVGIFKKNTRLEVAKTRK